MIEKISVLKNFGIFDNYNHNDNITADFKRFNLFYGCNGSGKSTLGKLLRCVELKKQSDIYPASEWEIITTSGKIDNKNVFQNSLNIKVFNKDFVKANIFWDEGVKGIVYISEMKVSEKKELEEKEKELKEKVKKEENIRNEIFGNNSDKKSKGLSTLNENFLSDAAKRIKISFKIIEIEDSRLLNYDKTKLSKFMEDYKDEIKQKKNVLTPNEIEKLSKSIKPQDRDVINNSEIMVFDENVFDGFHKNVKNLLSTTITAKVIDHLRENPNISKWVYTGLKEIHADSSTRCEFCGQIIPKERIDSLNKHFSDEFEVMKQTILEEIDLIKNYKVPSEFPHYSKLYDEYIDEYQKAVSVCEKLSKHFDEIINNWIAALEKKLQNPFDAYREDVESFNKKDVEEYKESYLKIKNYIEDHNKKFKGLDNIIKENKHKLELHYVSEEANNYQYFEKKKKEIELLQSQKVIEKEVNDIKNRMDDINKSLSNETIGAKEFNKMLHKFLGRNDLSLELRKEGGYLIERTGRNKAENLSEGEQSAIALVYFITKLREGNNKIEDTVVVIDDPVSSFDFNHLFHANFYIEKECENAKQLFVFTHSFPFFALQKDWMSQKKEKDVFKLYVVKPATSSGLRIGSIENADNVLTYFDSEYHLLFSEVKKFCNSPSLDYIDVHTIANKCRQLLESFLTFKYGRKKLEKCFDEIKGFNDIEKVRKFVNHYSHKTDNGACIKGFNDNVFAEADKIVPLVLELIKHVDEIHYNSMINRLNNV